MVKKTIKKIEPVEPEVVKESAPEPKSKATRRGCLFCESKQIPSFTDTVTLKRFLSERGKILPKGYSHLCSKHQRVVAKNIKYARHLSLLPFTPKV